MNKTMVVLTALALMALVAPAADAHISNDANAGGCPDDGSIHYHTETGCFSVPGESTVRQILERGKVPI